jgi:hypothetical protein
VLEFKRVTSEPITDNVAVLSDGKLSKNYGPVFRNGVVGGSYKIDLGKDVPVQCKYYPHITPSTAVT